MIRMSDLGVQVSAVSKRANQHFRHHPKPDKWRTVTMDALTRTEFYGSFPTTFEPKTKLGDSNLSIGVSAHDPFRKAQLRTGMFRHGNQFQHTCGRVSYCPWLHLGMARQVTGGPSLPETTTTGRPGGFRADARQSDLSATTTTHTKGGCNA
jgi:hypothetical protein